MELKGVLITGVYGTGKTSVVEELAEMLEDAEVSYGGMELDWLMGTSKNAQMSPNRGSGRDPASGFWRSVAPERLI